MWRSIVQFGPEDNTHTATKQFATLKEAVDETNKEVAKTIQENLNVRAEIIEIGGGGEI